MRLAERSAALRPSLLPTALASLWPVALVVVIAILLQLFVKPFLGPFYSKIFLDIGISVMLAVSLTMVNGFTGQFSIGHAAFMMVGGYTAAMIMYYGSFRFFGDASLHGGLLSGMLDDRQGAWLTGADALFVGSLFAAGIIAAVCGYVVGLPSLRLKGDYLAIVTLGFGEIVRVLLQSQTQEVLSEGASVTQQHLDQIPAWAGVLNVDDYMSPEHIAQVPIWVWPNYVGGALGFSGLPFYTSLFWVGLLTMLTLLVAYRIKRSAMGRAFLSIREDEIASEAMGVNTTAFKVKAFVIAAFFAGVAGGLFAHTVGVQLNPGELGFQKSFDIIIMVVLGGLGSISGATIAAAIVTILPELLRDPTPLLSAWPGITAITLSFAVVALVCKVRGAQHKPWTRLALFGAAILLLGLAAKWAVSEGYNLGSYRMIIYALALILMMILRPQGLFGVQELWERSFWQGIGRAFKKPARRAAVAAGGGA
jgi:branched-chain amino acid transport system permease protein